MLRTQVLKVPKCKLGFLKQTQTVYRDERGVEAETAGVAGTHVGRRLETWEWDMLVATQDSTS